MKKILIIAIVIFVATSGGIGYLVFSEGRFPVVAQDLKIASPNLDDKVPTIYISPECYVDGKPEYMSDRCPKPKLEPAYNRISGADLLPRDRVEILSPPVDKPVPVFVDPYPISKSATTGGLTLINSYGNGNYSVTAPDGGLTTINSSGGMTVITPADSRPMTICSGSSCFTN